MSGDYDLISSLAHTPAGSALVKMLRRQIDCARATLIVNPNMPDYDHDKAADVRLFCSGEVSAYQNILSLIVDDVRSS